jgi:undecaprenyl-diphosphatase
MTILEALLIGILQGFTEFLPISSSGHLVLAESFFQIETDSFFLFNIVVHIATLLAVIIYFRHTLANIILSLFRKDSESLKLGFRIIVGTIPLVIFVLLFNDFISVLFDSAIYVFIAMFATALLFLIAEYIGKKYKTHKENNFLLSLIVGLAQALAVLPGISRAGITLVAGLIFGMDRSKAAEFSFLLAIPAIAGAGVFSIKDAVNTNVQIELLPYSIGFIASFVTGYLSIWGLLKLYKTKSLLGFAIYLLSISTVGMFFLTS